LRRRKVNLNRNRYKCSSHKSQQTKNNHLNSSSPPSSSTPPSSSPPSSRPASSTNIESIRNHIHPIEFATVNIETLSGGTTAPRNTQNTTTPPNRVSTSTSTNNTETEEQDRESSSSSRRSYTSTSPFVSILSSLIQNNLSTPSSTPAGFGLSFDISAADLLNTTSRERREPEGIPTSQLSNCTEICTFNDENVEDHVKICSICRESLTTDLSYRKIKRCGHVFHAACIEQWLNDHQQCPECRQNVIPSEMNSSTTSSSEE